jgi:hypothetical protein
MSHRTSLWPPPELRRYARGLRDSTTAYEELLGDHIRDTIPSRYSHHQGNHDGDRPGITGQSVEFDDAMWRHRPIGQRGTRIDALQPIALLKCRWCGYSVYRGAGVYPR